MKCLKVEDYVKRTACPDETRTLCLELESYVASGTGSQCRTVCDRVIRACHERLGSGSVSCEHLDCLMGLVKTAVVGHDSSRGSGLQTDPLYMEKIVYHILKKVAALGSSTWSQSLGDLLYDRLASAAVTTDCRLLARSCFAELWGLLTGAGHDPDWLITCQLRTLRFILLEGDLQKPTKVPRHAEDAVLQYIRAQGGLKESGARFLLEQIQKHLFGTCPAPQSWPTLCEASLSICRPLGQAGLWGLATELLEWVYGQISGPTCLALALQLGRSAIALPCTSRGQCEAVLSECARSLRGLQDDLGHQERYTVLQACQLLSWTLKRGQPGPLGASTLLAWFSFLEEYQDLLEKHIQASSELQTEQKRDLQQTLCNCLQQSLTDAYDSLSASQLEEAESLEQVLLYCRSTAGRLVTALQKLPAGAPITMAAFAINSLVCGLYNRGLYDQAFSLAEILCQELRKSSPPSLPVEKLNRAFMLAVQCCRRAGRLESALDWVQHWLQALGEGLLEHMTEPVSLWAKTKADAARAGQEDTRLRTLRDGVWRTPLEEEVMLRLLEEELRAYRAVGGDTAQERYNVLCDLLELCPEGTAHSLERSVYLCDMAQVVCFQDFSEQTDCSAVDFTEEALRLLEEEPETTENSDRLKDHKAQALLWFYICSLEKDLQEAKERDQRLAASREQSVSLEPQGTNDMDYEDKQKRQDSQQVYESLRFNLSAQSKQCDSLDRALDLWKTLLAKTSRPAVRCCKQTVFSIVLMGALYKLMGKPLQALESSQLAVLVSRGADDHQSCAANLCNSTRLLLELGSPELAQAQLEQAEKLLSGSPSTDGLTPLSLQATLLRAQLCQCTEQVELGVSLLNRVLAEVGQRQSKVWYLLRARALQLASSYLRLDTSVLPPHLHRSINEHGVKTADSALQESMKLLCSLVVTLLGNGFYGASSAAADTRFVDQGDNVLLKWQLLSEVLSCSLHMVSLRSHCGAVPEAKGRCLEALKLATKLQTLSLCAELLVVKAELELQRAELDLCGMDLEQVKGLLDLCIDFRGRDVEKKSGLKMKLQKGRLPKSTPAPAGPAEEDYSGLLRTRAFSRAPADTPSEWGLSASPPLKPKPESWLSSLGHEANCPCPCCSDPALGRVVVRWAAARAELTRRLRQDGAEKRSRRLFLTALSRSKSATSKLGARLVQLIGASDETETSLPSFLHDLMARIHLRMALSSLEPQAGNGGCSWELLEWGLAFVGSRSSPELAFVRAGLQAAKALMSILALASKRGCRPEELFSPRWMWNPSAAPKTEPLPMTKKAKGSNPLETKKVRELANGTAAVPKLKVMLPSSQSKSTKAAVGPKPARTPREGALAFDFDDEVPQIAMSTPAQKVRSARSTRCGAAKSAPKLQFQVYDESSPGQDRLRPVPAAPKRGKRSRFKVDFSDDSDAEAEAPVPAGVAAAKTTTSVSKPSGRTSAQTPASSTTASKTSALATNKTPGPRKQGRPKKSTALPVDGSSSDEGALSRSAPRRGRPRKPTPAACEEPERMRTIKEEAKREAWLHDTSVEELRASDLEEQAGLQDVPDKDLEVLRREPALHHPMEGLGIIRAGGHSATLPSHLAHPNAGLGSLSLDAVEGLLRGALESLHHLPPPGLFPQLCSLLALCVGQSDPESTALLHAQALGLTARHDMNRHLCSRLTKLRKAAAPDLSAQLKGLSLDASPSPSPLLQRLSRLQSCFSFPALEPGSFPSLLKQQLSQQLQSIPAGVTVCLLSLVGAQVGEVGDTILLSRLERGSPPITVCIPTAQYEAPIRAVLQEMDCVQREQKVVSSVADKAQWWAGRRALDQRMQRLLEQMRDILGCWQGLLLPLTSDPELPIQARALLQRLSEYGAKTTIETLQAVLSASPLLSTADLLSLAGGLCAGRASDALTALQEAVSVLQNRTEPQGHTVLLLDKYLQKLPWENISCLRCRSVTRMPSLHFLLGHCTLRELDPDSVLNCRVDPQQVYYLLNPDASLKNTEGCFKEWFTSESAWQGVCGAAPSTDELQQAVATKDLYIYVGHGAGARFLDSRRLLSQELRAAALLFGCSSAALAVHGELEGAGVILNYLMAGCPLVLGNLWDVTDRDIDRFTKALLQSWLSARGTGLLDHMNSSRQTTYLKYLIGAAPVVYGLPVYLK